MSGLPQPEVAARRRLRLGPGEVGQERPRPRIGLPAPPNRKPVPANSSRTGKRSGRTGSSKVKGDRRRQLARAGRDGTPSTNASVTDSEDGSASPTPSSLARTQADGAGDRASDGEGEEDLEEGEDTTLYCFCQKVSFGDMVGCDNDNCKYQWFHWSCVGLKSEPAGEWLCPECRKLPKGELVVSK